MKRLTPRGAALIARLLAVCIEAGLEAAVLQESIQEKDDRTLADRRTGDQEKAGQSIGCSSVRRLLALLGLTRKKKTLRTNPIEQTWSKLKTHLCSAAPQSKKALEEALTAAIEQITAVDPHGWYASCGYYSTLN